VQTERGNKTMLSRRFFYGVLIASITCLSGVSAQEHVQKIIKPTRLVCILGVEKAPVLSVPLFALDKTFSELPEIPENVSEEELKRQSIQVTSDFTFEVEDQSSKKKKHYKYKGTAELNAHIEKIKTVCEADETKKNRCTAKTTLEEEGVLHIRLELPLRVIKKRVDLSRRTAASTATFDIPTGLNFKRAFSISIKDEHLAKIDVMCTRTKMKE
jgi:hypothetical protein